MPKHQVITSPNGDEMVVISKAEYDRLVRRPKTEAEEDEADARLGAAILGRIKRGEEETFPFTLTQRIAEGDSRIKVYREHRGLTQKELAAKVGINPVYLSQIETGVKIGSLETLAGIARSLKVELNMIAPPSNTQKLTDSILRSVREIVASKKSYSSVVDGVRSAIEEYCRTKDIDLAGHESRTSFSRWLSEGVIDLLRSEAEYLLQSGQEAAVRRVLDKLLLDKTWRI